MVNLQQPSHREGSRLLLVDSSVLPEVFLRVVEAKRMLAVASHVCLDKPSGSQGVRSDTGFTKPVSSQPF